MKKCFKIIFVIIIITGLIYLANKLDILDFSKFLIKNDKIDNYLSYYYSTLEVDEKKMYVKIDEALKNNNKKVFLGLYQDIDLTKKVTNVVESYLYDNPQYYYISSEYTIEIKDFKLFKALTVKFNYIVSENEKIDKQNIALENVINKIVEKNIHEGMSEFEMQLALHDALVQHVNYYEHENIVNIPDVKHTAYGALVEKEAVCDGYAKAFKMLLEKVGIESIIVNGRIDNVAHAWNMVKLQDSYYHVDVTSNKLEENSNKYVIHRYFNINDEVISKTHTLNKSLKKPESNSINYNYYMHKEYYINNEDNLKNKLKEIISKQSKSNILEVKVGEKYSSKDIINMLYSLNFNNWRSSGKTTISYTKIEDVYIFINE